jgi:hypothetical protein
MLSTGEHKMDKVFDVFCKREQVEPQEVKRLIRLIEHAYLAGERDMNKGTSSANVLCKKVEKKAESLGWRTQWPGLYPVFINKQGQYVYVPLDV